MKKVMLLLVILFLGCVAAPPQIEVAKEFSKPVSHTPEWNAVHPAVVKGEPLTRYQCVLCHTPKTSCDRCHDYVGIAKVYGSRGDRSEH